MPKKETMQQKSLNAPDEVRVFDKGKLELASLAGVTFGRATFQPGWKWSESVKPLVKTDWCEAPHVQYHVSGRLRVLMYDGTEMEFGPGDVGVVPPKHDAWVVGDEPVTIIDISGMKHYAQPKAAKPAKKKTKAAKKTKPKAKKRRR